MRQRTLNLLMRGILAVVTPASLLESQVSASKPAFEIASVKPSAAGDIQRLGPGPLPGGRVVAKNVTLKMLIAGAYNVREENISGGPNWTTTDRWSIEAKAEEGSTPPGGWPDSLVPDHPLTLMLQSLLEDRFQLKAHRETKDVPVYELRVAKTGSKMKLTAGQDSVGRDVPRGMMRLNSQIGYLAGNGIPMAKLAGILSEPGVLGRPVIDKTELKSLYDFVLEWAPESGLLPVAPGVSEPPPSSAATSKPSILTAIQEQLGLKVESTKGPVGVLVIDHVERPSQN
jgi:uncharacterized protein (TIGR03435 family)